MVTLLHGDCLVQMAGLEAGSIDSIVTDPPYGLSFMGKGWDHGVPGVEFWTEAMRVAKPGCHLLAFGGTRTYHRLACAIEDAGWEIRDCVMWVYGSGFPKSHNLKDEWKGWGTALKPAWEPIIVARKPLDGTVAENVTRHGTGAINVDGCRVATDERIAAHYGTGGGAGRTTGVFSRPYQIGEANDDNTHGLGRWPANVIHDGSEEVIGLFPMTTSGSRRAGVYRVAAGQGRYGEFGEGELPEVVGDSGSAARFFYCAKASKADRDEGCEGLPVVTHQTGMGGAMPTDDDGKDRDGFKAQSRNHHPTVKPTALMRYLCRLVTPPNGLVLDPFCGSGSTGKAATLEGFRFVGIEREAEYIEIARARIKQASKDASLFTW